MQNQVPLDIIGALSDQRQVWLALDHIRQHPFIVGCPRYRKENLDFTQSSLFTFSSVQPFMEVPFNPMQPDMRASMALVFPEMSNRQLYKLQWNLSKRKLVSLSTQDPESVKLVTPIPGAHVRVVFAYTEESDYAGPETRSEWRGPGCVLRNLIPLYTSIELDPEINDSQLPVYPLVRREQIVADLTEKKNLWCGTLAMGTKQEEPPE